MPGHLPVAPSTLESVQPAWQPGLGMGTLPAEVQAPQAPRRGWLPLRCSGPRVRVGGQLLGEARTWTEMGHVAGPHIPPVPPGPVITDFSACLQGITGPSGPIGPPGPPGLPVCIWEGCVVPRLLLGEQGGRWVGRGPLCSWRITGRCETLGWGPGVDLLIYSTWRF